MRRVLGVTVLFIAFTSQVMAQSLDTTASVVTIARALPNSIMLRWAPTTPLAWQMANKWGYKVERFTVLRNGEALDNPEYALLTPLPFKPRPLDNWEELVNSNDYAAVAAQAIYGETFEMDAGDPDIMQVYRKTQELELRFSFALFAADVSRAVASASALFYVDRTAKDNEEYLYRVSTHIPAESYRVKVGGVLISLADYAPLPAPLEFHARFGDKIVELPCHESHLFHIQCIENWL